MVNQNKTFSFRIKRRAKDAFPYDVERTVVLNEHIFIHLHTGIVNGFKLYNRTNYNSIYL